MRIFVAGATGAVGRLLIPMLVGRGHEVAGTVRSPGKADQIEAQGGRPYEVDALDADQVGRAVTDFGPEVIVHQLTALSGRSDLRHFDQSFAATNELRTRGTDNLLTGARAAGTRRMVAQSFGGWPYTRVGGPVKGESEPLTDDPPSNARESFAAIEYLEHAVMNADPIEGVVLRYGMLYGPDSSLGRSTANGGPPHDGEVIDLVRRRRFPVVGKGGGIWSFLHVEDAARAAVTAAEGGPPGVYNIVDDDPAPVNEWLPYLASVLGARPPMHVPDFIVGPAIGQMARHLMEEARGASNTKARDDLGFNPRYSSWREGFRVALG